MKRWNVRLLSLLAGGLLLASPVAAKSTKHTASCSNIRAALASGKSVDEVASQYKVSTSKVDSCSKSTKKSAGHASSKSQ